MKLINGKGMNCYYSCIASIADYFGLDYRMGCGNLWSENNFQYDAKHQLYLSPRFMANLELLGVKLTKFNASSPKETTNSMERILSAPDVMVVGIDAFHLPWSAIYHLRYGLHYFFGMKADNSRLICFDPLYQVNYISLSYDYIATYAFDICCAKKLNSTPLEVEVHQDATVILRQHPDFLEELIKQVHSLESESKEKKIMLGNYLEALCNNRFRFQEFLGTQTSFEESSALFNEALLSKWIAAKNGLYKMAYLSDTTTVCHSVCRLLEEIIAEEIYIASSLIKHHSIEACDVSL